MKITQYHQTQPHPIKSTDLSKKCSTLILSVLMMCLSFSYSYAQRPDVHDSPHQYSKMDHTEGTTDHQRARPMHRRAKKLRAKRRKANRGLHKLREHLIPPRFIVRYETKLDLSPEQMRGLKSIMVDASAQQIDQSFKTEASINKLEELIKANASQSELLNVAEQIVKLEGETKLQRLATALKARELLTQEQRAQALKIKRDKRQNRKRARQGLRGRRKARGRIRAPGHHHRDLPTQADH